VINASLLGTKVLARINSITGDVHFLSLPQNQQPFAANFRMMTVRGHTVLFHTISGSIVSIQDSTLNV
jgi:hypothetical protein